MCDPADGSTGLERGRPAEGGGRFLPQQLPAVQEHVVDGRALAAAGLGQVIAGHGQLVNDQQVGRQDRQDAYWLALEAGRLVGEGLREVPCQVDPRTPWLRRRCPAGRREQPEPLDEAGDLLGEQRRRRDAGGQRRLR